jgi:hypothetical protein
MKIRILIVVLLVAFVATSAYAQPETIKTRIGDLSFTHDFVNGYPTDATQKLLFEEMDFQRACQAYIWSIPIVSMAQWQYAHTKQLGAENGQIVFVESYDRSLTWPTAPGWS